MRTQLILSLLALLTFSHIAHAELVFDISEEIVSPTQTNLLFTVSGSVDTDGLAFDSTSPAFGPFFNPESPFLLTGSANVDYYVLPDPLPSFGTYTPITLSTSSTGSIIVYDGTSVRLGVPDGYVSESSLESTVTFRNYNFDAFNLIAGQSYSVSWAVGTADEDRLTVNIVPEPSSILLIGTAGGLLALARQKRPYTWREK